MTLDNPFQPRITVASVIERDSKFLMVEEEIDGQILLNQPAGHLEPSETLVAAAIREALEETGWEIKINYLLGIHLLEKKNLSEVFMRFSFSATAISRNKDRKLDEGIIRAVWLPLEKIKSSQATHRSPLVMDSMNLFQSGARHPLEILHGPNRQS
jgi:8-oxo-dGTP pyrophosphatase MutT (NUDIX family)